MLVQLQEGCIDDFTAGNTVAKHVTAQMGWLKNGIVCPNTELKILYIYIYLDPPTPLNFWWHVFPTVYFLKLSTVFCMLVMFTRGGTAETVEIK